MNTTRTRSALLWHGLAVSLTVFLTSLVAWSAVEPEPPKTERQESISISDAVLHALERNLDITISRQTKESRLTDIVFEQAKFDPTASLNAQYSRLVQPLNRPVLG